MKVFILYAKENWITDQLVKEWIENNQSYYTSDINICDIIWIVSDYIVNNLSLNVLKKKKVITTIHHITPWKVDDNQKNHFNILNDITDVFHSICEKTTTELKKYFTKKIITVPLWHNEEIWKFLNNKEKIRQNFKFNKEDFLIGSFQRDTEGNSISNKKYLPKLEKGPDIFIQVIKLLKETKYPNLKIILTGLRRQYLICELDKLNIKYYYFEMCDFDKLNKLYNCLDLYIVSSRVEGGPRAINECALTKTPLVSTKVGISDLLCYPKSLFDMNNIKTILECETNFDYNYKKAEKYTIKNYMKIFTNNVFSL